MRYTVYTMTGRAAIVQQVNPQTTQARIFGAARGLFDRDGLAGLSMRKLADAVGLTPMAIYKHYSDKEALIDALMLDGFVAWEARVRSIRVRNPVRWVQVLLDNFLEFALSEPRRYEAAFLLPARKARQYPDDFSAGRSPVLNMVYARIEEAQAQGLVNGTSGVEIALHLSALGQGLISMHRAGRFVSEREFRATWRRAMDRALGSFFKISPEEAP